MLNQDWEIKPISGVCGCCQTAFTDRQPYVSRLIFGANGYERGDFCVDCWVKQDRAERTVSVWKGVFELPPPPKEEPLKKETAESLLRLLMDNDDPSKMNVIFILTVMLERRRILVEKEVHVRDDGVTMRIYEHRKTGETFLIADPLLRLDQLDSVQREVLAMLSGGEGTENTHVGHETDGGAGS